MRNPFAQLAAEIPVGVAIALAMVVGIAPFVMNWSHLILPAIPLAIAIAIFGAYGAELRDKRESRD